MGWGDCVRPLWRFHCWSLPFLPQVFDAEGAELLVCQRAVTLAKEVHVNKLVLETDCKGAGLKLLGDDVDRSMHGPLVEEIRSILRSFEKHSVRTVCHKANKVAHLFAKVSCDNKYCNCNTWCFTGCYCISVSSRFSRGLI
jgi:hypothetical protein